MNSLTRNILLFIGITVSSFTQIGLYNAYSKDILPAIKLPANFSADFASNEISIPDFKFNPDEWQINNGVFENIKQASFSFGNSGWKDYEIELQIRQVKVKPNTQDQHFSILLRCDGNSLSQPKNNLRFYCRGDEVVFLESVGNHTGRHWKLKKLPQKMQVGENSPWTTFRFAVKGTYVKVYVNNKLVGEIRDILDESGKIFIYPYNLSIQIQNIKVTLNKTAPTGRSSNNSKNILRNSSFEQNSLDSLPDYWGCLHWGIIEPYWVMHYSEWVKCYGVDDNTAFDGKQSMRITNPFDKANNSALVLRSCCLGTKVNQKYTLSAYMKSNHDNMIVNFNGKKTSLTRDWKRYSTTFMNNGKSIYQDMLNLSPNTKGTFWIDAIQLEAGQKISPYAKSILEHQAMQVQEGNNEKKIGEVPIQNLIQSPVNPSLDGLLNESLWEKAEKVNLLTNLGDKASNPTEARMFYTKEGVYIGIICHDNNAGNNKIAHLKHDECVWNDPSIELFVDPNLTRNYYYHLAFNQKGVQYDSMCGDVSWNGQWKVATATTDDGKSWTAEVFLPFGDLGIDKGTGELWGLNICRYDATSKEACCWSPTFGSYHTPERFGQIRINKNILDTYCWECNSPSLKTLSTDEYALSLKVSNKSSKSEDILLKINIIDPKGCNIESFEKTLCVKSEETVPVEFIVKNQISAGEKYQINANIFLKNGRTLCLSKNIAASTLPLLEIMPQFDTYTNENTMVQKLQIGLGNEILNSAEVEIIICDQDGKNFFKKRISNLSRIMETSFQIKDIPCGIYHITGNLLDANGKCLSTLQKSFRKLPPQASEVKIDHIRQVTLVDNKPFIPLGFSWEGKLTPEIFEYLAKNGCNAISIFPAEKDVEELLENAEKYKIKLKLAFDARKKEETLRIVKKFKGHPALLAWDVFDEVFTGKWGQQNYDTVVNTCMELKNIDPYHPVYINENLYGITYLQTKQLAFPGDIVSTDYYAYPPSRSIQVTSSLMQMMREMGKADGRPCWIYLLGAGYAFWASRDYTPAEHEFSAYTSIINGCSGIFYFASHPKSKSSWKRIRRILKELTELTPVIASIEKTLKVQCATPAIQILVKKYEGKTYIITVNSSKEPVEARFAIPGLKAAKVRDMFENREIKTAGEFFEDRFEGYQRHVYVIKK